MKHANSEGFDHPVDKCGFCRRQALFKANPLRPFSSRQHRRPLTGYRVHQPAKGAAMEGIWRIQKGAPMTLFGLCPVKRLRRADHGPSRQARTFSDDCADADGLRCDVPCADGGVCRGTTASFRARQRLSNSEQAQDVLLATTRNVQHTS